MTPPARVAAAIDILDRIIAGQAAEKVLTSWGRGNRYAGSGDRAAVRDHVFTALRNRRSFGHVGGSDTGRGLMIGWATTSGMDHSALFNGEKYSPDTLTDDECASRDLAEASRGVRLDCPDWMLDLFDAALAGDADAVLASQQSRAPVFLRVNTAKCDLKTAQTALTEAQILTRPNSLSDTALEVLTNPRRVAQSRVFTDGWVELQDAASQAVVDFLPLRDGQRVLDYCAGGGGKSLAMAARANISLTACDIDAKRLRDLPVRAARAGVRIDIATSGLSPAAQFDLVLCDAPCSGSGAWRRSPGAKWRLNAQELEQLVETQSLILDQARAHVATGGVLAYVTCSLFDVENNTQVTRFVSRHPNWKMVGQRFISPLHGGDGFFVALLKRV